MDRLTRGKFVLIAEIGVNYYDISAKLNMPLLAAAKLMIKEAYRSGIHAVKFQSYKAGTLAAKVSPSYWDLQEVPITSQRELFEMFDQFGAQEYQELAEYADRLGIEFFSTAFDYDAADYLENYMNVYKVSASDLSNLPFIEYQAKKNKPILLSIGASNEEEIQQAVDTIRKVNDQPLVLMHCVLEYPTPLTDVNLNKISSLKKKYPDCFIGYSDHSKPTVNCDITKVAYVLGAQVIEKHFTLDKTLPGNDHFHSMDTEDAKRILAGIDYIDMIRGSGKLSCLKGEQVSRQNARRSLVSAVAIPKGSVITREMLIAKRPGTGISPQDIDLVIGRRAKDDIPEDVTMQFGMLV